MTSGHGDHCYARSCPVTEHVHDRYCRDSLGDRTCTQPEHNHEAFGCPRVKTCSHPED